MGGIDIFLDRASGKSAKDRIVTIDEVIARDPEVIIGSWCGKKFRPEKVAARPGLERPAGMADLSGPDRLEERLGEADFVIVTTPETPDTVGMFNARLFSRMKRGAYFINIARGPLCRHPRPDCSPAVRP